MPTFKELIPDAEIFLSLAPEELAGVLLEVIKSNLQNERIHQTGLPISFADHHRTPDYSPSRRKEIELALSKAWTWLMANLLIVPVLGSSGDQGWVTVGRRGLAITTREDFQNFREAASFPKSLLHPSIADRVWLDLMRGNLDTAVFIAFKAVEESVRAAGGFSATDYGVDLMRRAFNKSNGPLSDMTKPEAEREALANLFAGAIGSYKNPHSHRTVSITDHREAQEMVMLATHLLRIVDARGSP